MSANTGTINLIATLTALAAQFGPTLVKGVSDLIHGNPQQPGEPDDAYAARLNALSEAKLADAAANDAKVEQD